MTKEYVVWDEVGGESGRILTPCPICGVGVFSPVKGPNMTHKDCIPKPKGDDMACKTKGKTVKPPKK